MLVLTVPELSVAVGVGQLTGVLVVPNGTVTVMSSGNDVTCGRSVSAIGKENEDLY